MSSIAVFSSHDCVTESNCSGHSSNHSAGGFSDVCHVFAEWELHCKGKGNVELELYVQVTVHRENLRINNQQDASKYPNFYFVTKLHVLGIYCAHHQELSAVYVVIGMFRAGYVATAAAT